MSVLIVFSLPIILFGQSHLSFDEQTLRFKSGFFRPALEDVNGDGFPDLIVAQCAETGETQKRISLFYGTPSCFAQKSVSAPTADGFFLPPRG
jgi:hypothetical protein